MKINIGGILIFYQQSFKVARILDRGYNFLFDDGLLPEFRRQNYKTILCFIFFLVFSFDLNTISLSL